MKKARKKGRRRALRRRYGHMAVGSLSALRIMETARKAYRGARATGRSPKGAHQSAFNAVRGEVGAGAWDIANTVRREAGE